MYCHPKYDLKQIILTIIKPETIEYTRKYWMLLKENELITKMKVEKRKDTTNIVKSDRK
jgi:hypothetical protein